MKIVPRVQTPIGDVALADELARAHADELGYPPSQARLGIAWAQVWGETGWGRWSWNHNLGNMACTANWPECMHLKDGRPNWETNPASRYRSYPSYNASARDYWKWLKARPHVLAAFDEGDAYRAAQELKNERYYEDSYEHYSAGLNLNFQEFKRRFSIGTRWARLIPLCAAVAVLVLAIRGV